MIFTFFSFAISNVGLSAIINYSLPVLMLLYPLAITLIILALTGNLFGHDKAVYVSVTVFTAFAALFDFVKTLPDDVRAELNIDAVTAFGSKIFPLFDLGLGWVVPAAIGLVLGLIIRFSKKIKNKA